MLRTSRSTRALTLLVAATLLLSLAGASAAGARPKGARARDAQLWRTPGAPTLRPSPAPATRSTLIGMRAPAPLEPYTLAAVNAWQGKTTALATIFRKSSFPNAQLVAKLAEVWAAGAVPVLSVELVDANATIASGARDAQIDATAAAIKTWLTGPDLAYGTGDDRRIYLRPGWEPNGNWYRWSPCHAEGGTAADYRAMWAKYHERFDRLGLDRDHVRWIFSVNQTDWKSGACPVEALYPGHRYVDWLGVDGYTWTAGQGPAEVFGPMVARLRALAPGTPVGITEAGAHSGTTMGKAAYLTAYFAWLRANGIGMASWFNVDKEKDWSVLGGIEGDETFTLGLTTFRAWKAYREGVAGATIAGSDTANPRLLTASQFAGR